jgi:endonuclease G
VTGSLYVDDTGNPLPADQIKWIGENGQARVAVPSHSFKTVILQKPDGTKQSYAFIVPNRDDLPSKAKDIQTFLKTCRAPITGVEQRIGGGAQLYSGLPASDAKLKADSTSQIDVPDPQHHLVAAMVFVPATFQRIADEMMERQRDEVLTKTTTTTASDPYAEVERIMSKVH